MKRARWGPGVAGVCAMIASTAPAAVGAATLEVESKIRLGDVRGRIDHLGFDLGRQRLFVAELGNDSVGIVDVKNRRVVRTLTGLRAPQGIGYVPATDTVYVANAADGSVHLFQGAELAPIGRIALGNDADNVRVDEAANRLFVGYGDGALAVIDTATRTKVADLPLKAHPEGFRLEHSGSRIFVNVPDTREIAVLDRVTHRQIASWETADLRANFPLALDESAQVLAVFRRPARLGIFRGRDGRLLAALDTCGDADDLSVDATRHRVYVSCGGGFVDVFEQAADPYHRVDRVPTSPGARTSLFVPELDRLFLAAPATPAAPASIWIIRPRS
jgi:YVTN family beta-propeller protein